MKGIAMRRGLLALLTVACLFGAALGQTRSGAVLPPTAKWEETPLLPGAKIAVLYGDLETRSRHISRAFPRELQGAGASSFCDGEPDRHLGHLYDGLGEQLDRSKSTAYPAGSFFVLPANRNHYLWTKDQEVVLQVSIMGPFNMTFVNPAEDPRKK